MAGGSNDFGAALTTLTSWARSLLDDEDPAAARTTLEVAQRQNGQLDATAARGLILGAFGLGRYADLRATNFETGTPSTIFGCGEVFGLARGDSTGLNIPGISSPGYGALRVSSPYNDNTAPNSHHREFRSAGRVFIQYAISDSVWGAWEEILNKNNIPTLDASKIGTGVFDIARIPVGQIVERGSNANGEYVRYGDGTQICWTRKRSTNVTAADGPLFRTSSAIWNFPAAFVGNMVAAFAMESGGTAYGWGALGSSAVSTVSMSWTIFRATASPSDPEASLLAIGRWF